MRPALASSAGELLSRRQGPMPLGRVMDVLDEVEFHDMTTDEALTRFHSKQKNKSSERLLDVWTAHAVAAYLTAATRLELTGPLLMPARQWAAESNAVEFAAFGRRYEGDGVRELRLLRHSSVKDRPVDKGEIAVAAFVLAAGRVVLGAGRGGNSYVLSRQEPEVSWVRIVEVGCEDGSHEIRFNGTAEQAIAAYREFAEPRLAEGASREDFSPGADCADCPLVAACPGIPRTPGLLGIPEGPWPRRTWSVTTARDYGSCRQLPVIKDLKLPGNRTIEYSAAARRGQAVHAWLHARHSDRERRPCRATDVPEQADAWQAGGWEVSGAEAELGVQLLGDHQFVCSLAELPPDVRNILPEHTIAAFDPLANVVIIAKVDLAIEHADRSWVLRETKTTRTATGADLIALYPQLALNLLLLQAGALPGGSARGLVELERLTPSGPVVVPLSLDDRAMVERCREVVNDLVRPWREDTKFSPKNRTLACSDCSVAHWCPDAEADPNKKRRSS